MEDLGVFIDSYIQKLSRKYGVKKPMWLFVNYDVLRVPAYIWPYGSGPGQGFIAFPERPLRRAWEKDPELAKRALEHIIAHEFRHYMQHLRYGNLMDYMPIFIRELGAHFFAVVETWTTLRWSVKTINNLVLDP